MSSISFPILSVLSRNPETWRLGVDATFGGGQRSDSSLWWASFEVRNAIYDAILNVYKDRIQTPFPQFGGTDELLFTSPMNNTTYVKDHFTGPRTPALPFEVAWIGDHGLYEEFRHRRIEMSTNQSISFVHESDTIRSINFKHFNDYELSAIQICRCVIL